MKDHTLHLLDDLLLDLKPVLRKQDPAWCTAEQNARALLETFRTAHTEDRCLICQVNDLLDAKGRLEEYERDIFFRLGLQMGMELGGLDLLGES